MHLLSSPFLLKGASKNSSMNDKSHGKILRMAKRKNGKQPGLSDAYKLNRDKTKLTAIAVIAMKEFCQGVFALVFL